MFDVNEGIIQVSYIIATILFILALGGLSNQETARRGNWYGIIGMAIALVATLIGDVTQNFEYLIVALLVGGTVGIIAARRVQMTQMPELVAILHSLVGLAAVAVGFANFNPDRCRDVFGLGDRFRQAVGPHQR
jgi:NAD(P) transhydrogenase subunit beta